jgi:DNA polymerase III delta prime subunit
MPLPYRWADLVLAPHVAEHLRELEARARLRGDVLDGWGLADLTVMGRGVSALFAGPSGCGKTMAAQVLARSLDLELYRVDLAGVVSKYIGETEKHLRTVFDACQRAPVLLLFDEADALFGKRTQVKDAHDRFANIEIDYLLQRMERFDGLAVLATNRKADLDSAFLRRLRFVIDFVPPAAAERESGYGAAPWRDARMRQARRSSMTSTGPRSVPNSTCPRPTSSPPRSRRRSSPGRRARASACATCSRPRGVSSKNGKSWSALGNST